MNKYLDCFKTKTRDCGHFFYYIDEVDEVSKAVQALIKKIHFDLFGGCLPNDWIYEQAFYAFERLEQCDCISEYERASCEIEADAYNKDLINWLHEPFALEYVDEELNEGPKPESLTQLISMAQIRAKERIYSDVWEFMSVLAT